MRKAAFCFLILFVLSLGVTSCDPKGNNNTPVSEQPSVTVPDSAQTALSPVPSVIPPVSDIPLTQVPSYPVMPITVMNDYFEEYGDITSIYINFPYIVSNGSETESIINGILRDMAFADYSAEIAKNGMELHVDGTVCRIDDDIISAEYTESGYFYGSPHDFQLKRGVTIDIKTGKRLRLSDIIPLDNIRIAFDNNEFTLFEGEKDAFYEPLLFETWFDQFDRGGEEPHYADYYLEETQLYIILEVSHAVGDYIVITCPIEKLL